MVLGDGVAGIGYCSWRRCCFWLLRSIARLYEATPEQVREETAALIRETFDDHRGLIDHRGLDAAFDALSAAISERDALQAARASAAFKFHLDIHLNKEDAHLYRLIRERVSAPDQAKALGVMSSTVPPPRFPEVIAWMFPLLGPEDRENMTRVWQMVMPAPVFAGVKTLIQGAIGDGWAELTRRIPTLL